MGAVPFGKNSAGASVLGLILLILWTPLLVAQEQAGTNTKKPGSGLIDYFLNYLNMAGTKKSNEFLHMSQAERNQLYFKTMVNPVGFVKSVFSAGIDQAKDKPSEWEQGHRAMASVLPTSWGSIPSNALSRTG